MNTKLYKHIEVWKATDKNKLIRFCCFEVIGENKYCVQSCDYFQIPLDGKQMLQLNKQAIELFVDLPPDERSETYQSLEHAIDEFEKEFLED